MAPTRPPSELVTASALWDLLREFLEELAWNSHYNIPAPLQAHKNRAKMGRADGENLELSREHLPSSEQQSSYSWTRTIGEEGVQDGEALPATTTNSGKLR